MPGHKKPKLRQLKRVAFAGADVPNAAPGPDQRWEDKWPLKVTPTQSEQFVIGGFEWQTKTQWIPVLLTLVYFLTPIWLVTIAWLFFERWRFGGWDFLITDWLANLWMQVPALGLTGLFLWALASNQMSAKNAAKQVLKVQLTDVGFSTTWMQLECWNQWSEVESIIDEEQRVGMKMRVDGEELVFPKDSFEDEPTFQQFRECLSGWAKEANADAATASADHVDDL
jgi:hypothetical protein